MAVTAATSKLPALAAVNGNAKRAFAFFKQKGYQDFQSAGIVGNLMWESGVDPNCHQRGGGPGRGIAQWETHRKGDGRWDDLVRYAKKRGKSRWDLQLQLDFIIYELDKFAYLGKKPLKASRNVDDATRVFCDNYERPGRKHMSERIKNAREVLDGKPGATPTETDLAWLERGSKGAAVKTMQYMMTARGYALTVDGDFGSVTETKVRAFQKSRDITVDGVVGPVTWSKLLYSLEKGSKGTPVKALQVELNAEGYRLKVDGDFGSVTKGAVLKYQEKKRLPIDGVVWLMTWGSLID